jgi:hypothetical protein
LLDIVKVKYMNFLNLLAGLGVCLDSAWVRRMEERSGKNWKVFPEGGEGNLVPEKSGRMKSENTKDFSKTFWNSVCQEYPLLFFFL